MLRPLALVACLLISGCAPAGVAPTARPSLAAVDTPSAGVSPQATPSPSSAPSVTLSSKAQSTSDPFRLTFELPKDTWTAGEKISGLATLSVTGPKGVDVGRSGGGFFGFEFADTAGIHDIQPVWTADCDGDRIEPGKPVTSPIKKTGGFSADDPDASFERAFLNDPIIELPAGDWRISAMASFVERLEHLGMMGLFEPFPRASRWSVAVMSRPAIAGARAPLDHRLPVHLPARLDELTNRR